MLNIHANLQEDTPVDTGFAVTNWIPSVGEPRLELAGTREEAESGRLNLAPQAEGVAALRAYELSQGDLYDTNNVDYVEHSLNRGTSAQAPATFVQRAIVRGLEETRA
jgi:hypothetical protein